LDQLGINLPAFNSLVEILLSVPKD